MTPHAGVDAALLRRIHWRILPFLVICYVLAQVDRLNVGFAQFGLRSAIGLDDLTYGRAIAIFFVGYIALEIPSNLFLKRFGARVTFGVLMCGWGLTTAATMFVTDIAGFNLTRLLLGAFEAGFFPGVVLYLTYWYPPESRAGVLGVFIGAVALSGMVVGPLSGCILDQLEGVAGLAGWQWLFLIEGLPAVIAGLLVFRCLADTPARAQWLGLDERALIEGAIEASGRTRVSDAGVDLLLDPMTYLLALIFFGVVGALYGLNFWSPVMIKEFGLKSATTIGLVSGLPYLCAWLGTILWGRDSDRRRERRWHFAMPVLLAAAAVIVIPWAHQSVAVRVALLSLAMAGILSAIPIFWAVAQNYYGPSAAPIGIAFVNSIGVLAGAVVPYAMGWLKIQYRGMGSSLAFVAGLLLISASLLLMSHRRLTASGGP